MIDGVKTWNYEATHPPGDGPWKDEPDKVQWVDKKTDLDCLAVRSHTGAWCGYVGIPPGHPWYDVAPGDIPADVHGCVNYGSRCRDDDPEPNICHVPEPGRPDDVYWIGFDCGHAWDFIPRYDEWDVKVTQTGTYRTVDYVMDEVTRFAAQAALVHR